MEKGKFKLNVPWADVKDKIKERNIHLTDEDLNYQPGKEDELLERLQKKMERSKEEIIAFIESIASNKDMAS